MAEPLQLNATFLRKRMSELGLRQWWLAEQLGVDRRTVLRWVNGHVRQITPDRAQALATLLGCPVPEMLQPTQATQWASPADQRAAGLALAGSALLDRLGPVGEWHVVEQLIKANAVPDLPLQVLGRLYHQLCVACWRQDKLAEATRHNQAALDLAHRCGDRSLQADALGSLANLQHWRGDTQAALATWRQALALSAWITPRQRGALHSNLGASLYEGGELAAGRAELSLALACFDLDGTPMNHSIARGHLALVSIAQGEWDEAQQHITLSQAQAAQADYGRGLALAPLLQALLAAHRGQAHAATVALARSQAAFAALGITESINHRLAAQVWRLLGDASAARQAGDQALRLAAGFPVELAAAQEELRRVDAMSPPVTWQPGAAPLP
jgi:tetratricopeptide (TPR) repeat protein